MFHYGWNNRFLRSWVIMKPSYKEATVLSLWKLSIVFFYSLIKRSIKTEDTSFSDVLALSYKNWSKKKSLKRIFLMNKMH